MNASLTLQELGVQKSLRPLSPYERLFTAIEKVNGLSFSVTICFRGTVENDRWTAAFAQAQQRHPFLNATLGQDDPHAPALHCAEGFPIPIAFQRRTSLTQWQEVMEMENAEPFDPSFAPLLRAILLEDGEGCDLVLTAHHTVLDGMGLVAFVRDLLGALAGEALPALPIPSSSEDQVRKVRIATNTQRPAASQALEAVQQMAAGRPAREFALRPGRGRPKVTALRISPTETELLLRCARQHGTTVGSVLLAALAATVRTLTPGLNEADIHLIAPVDARPYLENGDEFVLSIIVAQAVSLYPDGGLWASARALRSQLRPFQSLDEIEASYDRTAGVMGMKLDTHELVNILATNYGCDAMVTNLKCVDFPSVPNGLSVEAVWGPSVAGVNAGEQVVGVATFGGALHLVCTSHSPLTVLLETMRETMVTACADA